jgi:hemerythrin-like domain-containing protein
MSERELVPWLLDCHARMREMAALAVRLAEAPQLPEDELAESAARVRRYFGRALPQHERDEEDSIMPRLADRAAAALARMKAQHAEHEPYVGAVMDACEALASAPESWPDVKDSLARDAKALQAALSKHLDEEERDVFPHLASLDEKTRADIAREMESRRDRRA